MPVIPVNPNHPAASAVRKRTPSAAVRKSPPQAAKARANNALMHGASASRPPRCHDVASVAVASVATDAGNAAGPASALAVSTTTLVAAAAGSLASPACSVNSSNDSSDSKDSDMIGGVIPLPVLPVGRSMSFQSFQRMGMMLTTTICPLMQKPVSSRFWNVSSITWSGRKLVKISQGCGACDYGGGGYNRKGDGSNEEGGEGEGVP